MSARPGDALRVALANDELDKFLVGEPCYFHEARNDNEEPQNVVAAFDLPTVERGGGGPTVAANGATSS